MNATERETWLAERRKGIGASEIAAIAGLSPWAGALDIYLQKLGVTQNRTNAAMNWGLRLEQPIADAYTEETGIALEPSQFVQHPEHSWVLATPDRFAADGSRLVELKCARTADGWGDAGTDQIPDQYVCQVHWQMLASGFGLVDVAVLIGGVDFRVYTVPRDERLVTSLFGIGQEFWRRVVEQDAPDVDWQHPEAAKLLDLLNRPNDGESVDLDETAGALATSYQEFGEQIKQMEESRQHCRALLVGRMGTASLGLLPDGRRITRKDVSCAERLQKAYSYTDFRIGKPKKAKVTA